MVIDLRSDTVTKPTKPIREAMIAAPVGDDVFGEDPTVIELEEKVARLFGKEDALFCPSGTMTNQIAIKVHTQPGDEVICDATAHIYNYESGGLSFNSGTQAKLVEGERGRISAKQVEEKINPALDWLARTSLVSIENTTNRAGGSYYTLQMMKEISAVCQEHHLKFHLDGARIFNALTETKDKPVDVGKYFDSISVCFSKGLGAPVGSTLIADQEFIRKARRVRKVLGGGMRQAGILAAACIYALDHHIERLKDDHRRARELEKVLQSLPYVENILPVETNIVIFSVSERMGGDNFLRKLQENNIQAISMGKQMIRFVTHLDFDDNMLEQTNLVLKRID